MHKDVPHILGTLLSTFANPAIAQTQDSNTKTALTALERLSIFLATEINVAPALRQQALQQYAALCPEVEKLLGEHGQSLVDVRQLEKLCASEEKEDLDAALALATRVFIQLQAVADEEAAPLRKKILAVESGYCEGIWAARDENIAATRNSGGSEGTVIQSRNYDQDKLADYIAATFPAEKDIKLVESNFISGGSSKYTLGLKLAGTRSLATELILRGDSISSSTFGGVPVKSEYELLQVLHRYGVCVPAPLAYEGSGTVFGSPFMLVERRPGAMIGHMFEMPAPNMAACRDVAEKLAQIHAVPLDTLTKVRGAERGTIDQVKDFLGESLANYRALGWSSPLYEAGFDWLQRNIGVLENTRRLVHGDYGLNNILIDGDRVSTILDWEFAHIGNPAYDLGYFYYQAESLGSWEAFLQAYRDAGGASLSDTELDYATLFAVVRLGVMVCQVVTAFRTNQISGLGSANSLINHMHETTINRMSKLLQRVL